MFQRPTHPSEARRWRSISALTPSMATYANWAFGWITADDLDFYHRICSSC